MPDLKPHPTIVLCAALFLSACGTSAGSQQTITIATDPAGATCVVMRGNSLLATFDESPGLVELARTNETLNIMCKKQGLAPADAVVDSGTKDTSLGSVLFKGVIGTALKAVKGGFLEYPSTVTLVMAPDTFPTIQAKQRYFASRKAKLQDTADRSMKSILSACQSGPACERSVNAIQATYKDRLDQLEKLELAAKP